MLPDLAGSPKQVSWAKRIRTERLGSWEKSSPELFKEVESTLKNEFSASWWITYREKGLEEALSNIQGGEVAGKPSAKPLKVHTAAKTSSPVSSRADKSFTDLAGIHRFVGETKDLATGEVVIGGLDCPF
jgi:hypothetical protein